MMGFAECLDRQHARVDSVLRSLAASALANPSQTNGVESLGEVCQVRKSLDRFKQEYRAGISGFTVAMGTLQSDVLDLAVRVAGLVAVQSETPSRAARSESPSREVQCPRWQG